MAIIESKESDGTYQPISDTNPLPVLITASGNLPVSIDFADNSIRDSFGNLRVTAPYTLFEGTQLVDKNPLTYSEKVIGAGANSVYQTNQASTLLTVPSLVISSVVRQSKEWVVYQPGKSQKVMLTGILYSGVVGIIKRIGLFEVNNGVFFQLSGNTLSVVVRTNTSGTPVDIVLDQSSWNIDTFDGSGVSGITLDITKTQLFIIDFQWSSVGRIRYGFSIDGTVRYCHEVLNANINTLPFMSIPNLPIRYEINNDGSGSASQLRHICASVDSEGGRQDNGYNRTLTRGIVPLVTNNNANIYPLIAFRLKSTHKHINITQVKLSIACSSSSLFEYLLIVNPIVTGTAFSWVSLDNSGIEYDVSRTNTTTISGGDMIIDGGLDSIGSTSVISLNKFNLGTTIDGVSDIVVLGIRRLTGNAETFYANMVINEL